MKITTEDFLIQRIEDLEAEVAQLKAQRNVIAEKEPETFDDCILRFGEGCVINQYGNLYCTNNRSLRDGAFTPSEKRARQLAAIAKMMTVADALNGCWQPKPYDGVHRIGLNFRAADGISPIGGVEFIPYVGSIGGMVAFKDAITCEKAIKILGEETIKTAFGL